MRKEIIEQAHPGVTIREDILPDLGLSVNQLAKAIGVTPSRLNDVVLLRRGVTADTALRLARYLGTTPEFWMNLQTKYDLLAAQHGSGKKIEKAVKPREAA